jgi:hypothetical protein
VLRIGMMMTMCPIWGCCSRIALGVLQMSPDNRYSMPASIRIAIRLDTVIFMIVPAESRGPARRIFSKQAVDIPQIELPDFSLPRKCEICALLGFYAAWNDISIPTIRDNLSIPSLRVRQSKSSRGLLDHSRLD